MKKIIITSIFSALFNAVSLGQSLQKTILSHEGVLTQYNANHWQDAFADAAAGDTIYFTPGTFTGSLIINKPVTIIGPGVSLADCFNDLYADCYKEGESAQLTGNITISLTDTQASTPFLIEGLYFKTTVLQSTPMSNLTIRRCHFNGQLFSNSSTGVALTNLLLENCYFYNLNCRSMNNPTIQNCYIRYMQAAVDLGITFTNCVVEGCGKLSGTLCDGSNFHNSIICSPVTSGNGTPKYSNFVNCIYNSNDQNSTYTDCWQLNTGSTMTAAQLSEAGYIGTDGSVVGPFGGPAPFTMIPTQPYVSSSSVVYDATTKKLNVNITVKKGK